MFRQIKRSVYRSPLSFISFISSQLPSQLFNKSLSQFGQRKQHNFVIDDLQVFEIMMRDYSGSLMHLLEVFKTHKVNLACIETRKLNKVQSTQNVLIRFTFDKQPKKVYNELLHDMKQRFEKVIEVTEDQIPEVPWYPRSQKNLELLGQELLVVKDEVNQDHPQFKDPEYRKRRDYIAKISQSHRVGQPVPEVDYTDKEHETWRIIYNKLKEEQQGVMSKRFLKNLEKVEKALGLKYKIPQLKDVDEYLQAETGFRIKAVHGILNQREFLNGLGHRIFCCTQYIRHHDTPEYTPEPDIVHELVGHVPMFADPDVADLSQEIGMLSCGAKSDQVARLGSIYWYTIEFGAHMENGQPRGYGAGIGSSIGECQHFRKNGKFEKLNPIKHSDMPFPIQSVQPVYLYNESFEEALQEIIRFGETLQKPFKAYYDFNTNEIKSDRLIKTYFETVDKGPKF